MGGPSAHGQRNKVMRAEWNVVGAGWWRHASGSNRPSCEHHLFVFICIRSHRHTRLGVMPARVLVPGIVIRRLLWARVGTQVC